MSEAAFHFVTIPNTMVFLRNLLNLVIVHTITNIIWLDFSSNNIIPMLPWIENIKIEDPNWKGGIIKMAREETFIINKIWDELSGINMHKINRVCQHNLQIGLIGSSEVIEKMMKWLVSFPYTSLNLPIDGDYKIYNNKEVMKRLILVPTEVGAEINEKLIKASDFCIVEPSLVNVVKEHHLEVYIFDTNDTGLAAQILANHERIRFTLSHNFPVFRPEHAKIEIQETAIQNTAWVFVSALPSFLPAPHRTIVAPLEIFADFIVLTVNEIKLMFEVIGLMGEKIQLKHILEIVLVISLAKASKEIANLILRSIPTQSALVVKAALAYAFTWAIGEAMVFFVVARQRVGLNFVIKRMKHYFREGLVQATHMKKKKAT